MEIVAPSKTVDFKVKDVTFHVRTHRTAGDRFYINTNGVLEKDGSVQFNVWEYYKALIKTFVVGWDGVTENGKPVPYSFEKFMGSFPWVEGEDDVVISLGVFVAKAVGISKDDKGGHERKNG